MPKIVTLMKAALWTALLCPGLLSGSDLEEASEPLLLLRSQGAENWVGAPVVGSLIHVQVTGVVAATRVTQVFVNPTEEWLEGIYQFPLPSDAAVEALRLRVGGRVLEGEVKERKAAEVTYQLASEEGRRAGLLTQSRPDVFGLGISAIGPGERVEVEIELHHLAHYDAGRFSLRLPLVVARRYQAAGQVESEEVPTLIEAPAASDRKAPAAGIVVDLDAGFDLAGLDSPTHDVVLEPGRGVGQVRVRLADSVVVADRDFVLEWAPRPEAAPRAVIRSERIDGDVYVLVLLVPAAPGTESPLPRHLTLVIDTSGSMQGAYLEQAKDALLYAMETLGPGDRFNVIRFDSTFDRLFESPQGADPESLAEGRRFVRGLQIRGGTNLLPALEAALSSAGTPDELHQVVLATDALTGDEKRLLGLLAEKRGSSRLFPVSIGAAPNASLVEQLARRGGGVLAFIDNASEVRDEMRRLLQKLSAPLLRNLEVQFDDLSAEIYPQTLPDLFVGQPVVVAARLSRGGGDISVRGSLPTGEWRIAEPLPETTVDEGPAKGLADGASVLRSRLDKVWARLAVEAKRDALAAGADPESVRRAVVDLALKHQIVTPYTSLVAEELHASVPAGVTPHPSVVATATGERIPATEKITVSSEAPLIDRFTCGVGSTIEPSWNVKPGRTRTYYGTATLLPGVTRDETSARRWPEVPGSMGGRELTVSQVWVDALETGSSLTGAGRLYLSAEAVKEVTSESSPANVSRRDVSGTLGVRTKSGTNMWRGATSLVRQDSSWAADYERQPELSDRLTAPVAADFLRRSDDEKNVTTTSYELGLGGPLKRDHAWFFGAAHDARWPDFEKTLDGEAAATGSRVRSRFVRLDGYQQQQSFTAAWADTPVSSQRLPAESLDRGTGSRERSEAQQARLSWNWAIGTDFFLETIAARSHSAAHREASSFEAQPLLTECLLTLSLSEGRPGFVDLSTGSLAHGWVVDEGLGRESASAEQLRSDFTWFVSTSHELKLGVDSLRSRRQSLLTRPDLFLGQGFDPSSAAGFRDCELARPCLFRDYSPAALEAAGSGSGRSASRHTSLYARDRFTVGNRWSLNLGLRLDDFKSVNDVGRSVQESTRWSPHLSASYDVRANGRTILKASLGRRYESLDAEWIHRALQEGWGGYAEFDDFLYCSDRDVEEQRCQRTGYTVPLRSLRPGALWPLVDAGLFQPDLRPVARDEWVLGFEQRLAQRWVLDIKLHGWREQDLIGAALQRGPDGELFPLVAHYRDWPRALAAVDQVEPEILASLSSVDRDYQALQIQLKRLFRSGWSFYQFVTVSRSRGPLSTNWWQGEATVLGERLDVVLEPSHLELCAVRQVERQTPVDCREALGPFLGQPLSLIHRPQTRTDRPLIWQTFGSKVFEYGRHELELMPSFHLESGRTWARSERLELPLIVDGGALEGLSNGVLLEPASSRRLPTLYWLDLSAKWSFPLRAKLRGALRLEIENLTNEQEVVQRNGSGAVRRSRRDVQRPREVRLVARLEW